MSSIISALAIVVLGASSLLPGSALEHPRNARLKSLVQNYKSHMNPAPVWAAARQVVKSALAPVQAPAGAQPIYTIVEREARRIGIDPVVMYAIQVHETGNYRSPKWKRWRNPGGIEYRERFVEEGIRCEKHGRWAGFATAEDGIRAHAIVLSNHRYNGARRTSDPIRQVEAIGRGGYCEPGYNWTGQVKAYVRRFLCRRQKSTTVVAID